MLGNSLEVQWLGLCASTAGGTGSIPGQRINILHALQCDQQTKNTRRVDALYEKSNQTGMDKDAEKSSSDVTENLPGAGCLA